MPENARDVFAVRIYIESAALSRGLGADCESGGIDVANIEHGNHLAFIY